MAQKTAQFANLGSLWKGKPDRQNQDVVLNGKISAEASVFLGLPPGSSILVMKNDKGDNESRPDYRVVIVVDADDGDQAKGGSAAGANDDPFA